MNRNAHKFVKTRPRLKSPEPSPFGQQLVRGYCRDIHEEDHLLAYGLIDKNIYMEGRMAETLAACLHSFRERPGILAVATDLRIFGDGYPAISAQVTKLTKAKIEIRDVRTPEATLPELLDKARVAVANARFTGNQRKAKRIGRTGGKAKGTAEEQRRNARCAPDIVTRLKDAPELTLRRKVEILGPGFSRAGLKRHY